MQSSSHHQDSTNDTEYPPEFSQSSHPFWVEGDMAEVGKIFLSDQSLYNIDVALSTSNGTARSLNSEESKQWPSGYAAQDLGTLEFSPTHVGVSSNVQIQPLSNDNFSPNHYPNPTYSANGEHYVTQPLVFDGFNVAAGEVQYGDSNAALTSTAIDFDFPIIGTTGSASASASHGLPDGDDLNDWGLSAGLSDSPGDAGGFMNGSGFLDNPQPLDITGGFVDTGFGFPTPWTPHNSMDGNFQSSIASNDPASSSQEHNDNLIWDPSHLAASMNESSSTPTLALPASTTVAPPPQSAVPAPLAASAHRHQCTYPPCTKTFKRDYERLRHENSKHVNTQGTYLCPIAGCPKSQGNGYSRPDKVTEHLWKKHGNLGYTKA